MSLSLLVVEDERDISLMLQDRLNFLGFYVTLARNCAEGMAMLDVTAVDGILLDIQMPVMDGLTMLKYLRERFPNIPVIVMSAELNKDKLAQTIEQGANDNLLKPIDVDLLAKKCLIDLFIECQSRRNETIMITSQHMRHLRLTEGGYETNSHS